MGNKFTRVRSTPGKSKSPEGVFYSKGDHSDNLQKGSCYLEVPGDGVNGDDPLPGKVLKRSCQESLREEESGDPVHLQPNIKLKSKLSCTLK